MLKRMVDFDGEEADMRGNKRRVLKKNVGMKFQEEEKEVYAQHGRKQGIEGNLKLKP